MAPPPRLTPRRRPESPRLHPDIHVPPLPPTAVEVIAVLWERRCTPLFRASSREVARSTRRPIGSVRRAARRLVVLGLAASGRGAAGGYYLTLSGHVVAAAYFGGEHLRLRDPTGKVLYQTPGAPPGRRDP